jgi:hypothetical protein
LVEFTKKDVVRRAETNLRPNPDGTGVFADLASSFRSNHAAPMPLRSLISDAPALADLFGGAVFKLQM